MGKVYVKIIKKTQLNLKKSRKPNCDDHCTVVVAIDFRGNVVFADPVFWLRSEELNSLSPQKGL